MNIPVPKIRALQMPPTKKAKLHFSRNCSILITFQYSMEISSVNEKTVRVELDPNNKRDIRKVKIQVQ
jgi:hypothetical protein